MPCRSAAVMSLARTPCWRFPADRLAPLSPLGLSEGPHGRLDVPATRAPVGGTPGSALPSLLRLAVSRLCGHPTRRPCRPVYGPGPGVAHLSRRPAGGGAAMEEAVIECREREAA